jgi:hypothetical protein
MARLGHLLGLVVVVTAAIFLANGDALAARGDDEITNVCSCAAQVRTQTQYSNELEKIVRQREEEIAELKKDVQKWRHQQYAAELMNALRKTLIALGEEKNGGGSAQNEYDGRIQKKSTKSLGEDDDLGWKSRGIWDDERIVLARLIMTHVLLHHVHDERSDVTVWSELEDQRSTYPPCANYSMEFCIESSRMVVRSLIGDGWEASVEFKRTHNFNRLFILATLLPPEAIV